jgi:hypothetical protein
VKHRKSAAIVAVSLGVIASLILNGIAGYLILNPRRVADQFRVWSFSPPAAIAEQIHRDNMSAEGKFLYLASYPKVEDKREFNQICSAVTIDTSILGCYLTDSKRIYLYHETDIRLDGTEEVMAAHEMLRAAWDRMNPAQRGPLLTQLRRVLALNEDIDLEVPQHMAAIRRDDPKDYDAELYATIGTELPDIGQVLESSYAPYFVHRSTVVLLYAHATAYVIALREKVNDLVATMNALNDTISSQVTAFNSAVGTLESDIGSFNARAETPGGFPSEAEFDAERAALVARGDSLTATAAQINTQIDLFNADLGKLKTLDKTALSLVKSLNIELAPVPSVTTA